MAPLATEFSANSQPPALFRLRAAALACLERGGAVVAANARAARSLRQSHAAAQRTGGRQAWPTPPIHDWESWLGILWHRHLENNPDAPLLLTPLQERAIWKRIARGSGNSEAVAKLAAQAWQLLSDFNAHGERNQPWSGVQAGGESSDPEVFRGWASLFDRECRSNRWCPRGGATALLAQSILQGEIDLPSEILLIGFDRLTPAQRTLLDAMRATGTEVGELELPPTTDPPQRILAGEMRDELTTCAWWLRRKLEENPSASIAVIAPQADEMRGEIHRIFAAILMPESAGVEAAEAMPFEFSLGVPLATFPIVKAALLALRWLVEPLPQSAITWLAISGFLAAEGEDLLEMAEFDAELRKRVRLPPEASLAAFLRYAPRRAPQSVRRFRVRLRRFRCRADSEGVIARRRTFAEWVAVAERLLRLLRWPGARTLESAEFQARARWQRLTDEVAALGFDGARVAWPEFVTALDRYAGETIFAPESQGAPIQIVGPLEASGQEFDALWFLGADADHWPARGQPSPLLPHWLQRKAEMPHSTLDADWAAGLRVTRRLASSAPECVFSHAQRNDDGELRPSALILEALDEVLLPEATGRLVSAAEFRAALGVVEPSPQRDQTESFEDGPSVPWPKEIAAGGADVLQRQSACAFRSFAVRRLGAEELEAADRGLNPRDRGILLHKTMEGLWSGDRLGEPSGENPAHRSLRSRDDLVLAETSRRLPEILAYHIDAAFRESFEAFGASHADGPWFPAYLQVERERLHSVLTQWLDYELKRQPFTVESHEQELSVEMLNGLKLDLRVDRVDRVEDGRLVFDYKTSRVNAAMWEGERPEEPQLPLYGAYGGLDALRGVLFAQVLAGETTFAGRVVDAKRDLMADLSPNSGLVKKPLDEDTLGDWADALSKLADQFLAGDARVAPRRYPETCKHCALPALCRVAETAAARQIGDAAGAEAVGVEPGGEESSGVGEAAADD